MKPLSTDDWPFRKRANREIPVGYRVWAEDPEWLEPIPSELRVLEEVYKLFDKKTYNAASITRYFVAKTGRQITRQGLIKSWKRKRGYIADSSLNCKRKRPTKLTGKKEGCYSYSKTRRGCDGESAKRCKKDSRRTEKDQGNTATEASPITEG